MKPLFVFRLFLDLTAACLLVLALAYWWLGNVVHELIGTGLFLLLIVHNLFNRRWYGMLARIRLRGPGLVKTLLHMLLLVTMLVLLVTSVLISQNLFPLLPQAGGVAARDLHILAAYWVLVIVGFHVGMQWTVVMSAARRLARIRADGMGGTLLLRLIALAMVAQGISSSYQLALGTRLQGEVSLDFFWDFEANAAGFLYHAAAICGLCGVIAHYTSAFARRVRHGNHPK